MLGSLDALTKRVSALDARVGDMGVQMVRLEAASAQTAYGVLGGTVGMDVEPDAPLRTSRTSRALTRPNSARARDAGGVGSMTSRRLGGGVGSVSGAAPGPVSLDLAAAAGGGASSRKLGRSMSTSGSGAAPRAGAGLEAGSDASPAAPSSGSPVLVGLGGGRAGGGQSESGAVQAGGAGRVSQGGQQGLGAEASGGLSAEASEGLLDRGLAAHLLAAAEGRGSGRGMARKAPAKSEWARGGLLGRVLWAHRCTGAVGRAVALAALVAPGHALDRAVRRARARRHPEKGQHNVVSRRDVDRRPAGGQEAARDQACQALQPRPARRHRCGPTACERELRRIQHFSVLRFIIHS